VLYVHHLENSRSQRVIWLLEELNLEYEIINHKRLPGTRVAPASLYNIHPLAKSPVLCDQEVVLAESGAIFAYLVQCYGNGLLEPIKGGAQWVQYIYWIHFAEGSFMPYLAMKLVFARIVNEAPFFVRPLIRIIFKAVGAQYLDPNIRQEINSIEEHLAVNRWFAGDAFTAADIMMGFMLEAVAGCLAHESTHPNIIRFVHAMRARQAYQQAVKRGNWSVAEHKRYWRFLAE
jgi:glutathione S-transferase